MGVIFSPGADANQTDVPIAAASSIILPKNPARKSFILINNSTTVDVWISYDKTAVVTQGKIIEKNGGYFEDATGSKQDIHGIGTGVDAGNHLCIIELV